MSWSYDNGDELVVVVVVVVVLVVVAVVLVGEVGEELPDPPQAAVRATSTAQVVRVNGEEDGERIMGVEQQSLCQRESPRGRTPRAWHDSHDAGFPTRCPRPDAADVPSPHHRPGRCPASASIRNRRLQLP